MTKLGDGSPVVMVAHGQMQMSRDTEYYFEQDRNFFYLSGVDEADWVLVMDGDKEYLIEPERSATEKIFNGNADTKKISKASGIDEIVSHAEGRKRLKNLKKVRTSAVLKERVGSIFINPAGRYFFNNFGIDVEDMTREILELRTIKQPEEIEQIKTAIRLTGDAFKEARSSLGLFDNESQLTGVFSGYFASNDTRHAYNPIVASGGNACTLHYTENNASLSGKGLVLLDIGAKHSNYVSDITRTWELSDVTERQREVLQVVKTAFSQIVPIIKPNLSFDKYQQQVDEIMTAALGRLGLKNDEENLRKYFPHSPTHGLGLDVHDPLAGYKEFKKNMVVTVEPGIYISEENIGVRYEDDLLITKNGVENLSESIM